MYYDEVGRPMGSIIDDWYGMVRGVPQTQQDIRMLAQTAQTAQSPNMQRMVQEIGSDVEMFAKVQLALQMFSTVAVVGIFLIALKNHSLGK